MDSYIKKFERIIELRFRCAILKPNDIIDIKNVKCEICGQNIVHYIGPPWGVACRTCLKNNHDLIKVNNPHSPLPQGEWEYRFGPK